jgi:2'-5' RNA ligase
VSVYSLGDVLNQVLEHSAKTAGIHANPRGFFVHLRLPDDVARDLRDVQARVVSDPDKHADIDHVTLVHTQKAPKQRDAEETNAALASLKEVGEQTEPIKARIQGWGLFDGAQNGGKASTALVALVDAPGLERLHTDMARALEGHGIQPSDTHSFTPHVTIAWLGNDGRVPHLPPIGGSFKIDEVHVAANGHHVVPLNGSVGRDAAKHAIDYSPESNFSMDAAAIKAQHRGSPGSGEGSPALGGVPLQSGTSGQEVR